jgi:hypothetical protein
MTLNEVFTELQCLSCTDYRSDFCKARLGAYFLACEAGQQPKMTRQDLTRNCCKHLHADDGITILSPDREGSTRWSTV